ncbi:hypothetical protein EI982_03195 [Haloplanus rallus]|uniref:Uncharacterized protein n=1 Tax=Haloplanus rallus TaxID=1816183 RepID=A0A6B9FCC3_9EURY|nr:hypothetical protein [Haloplanus rallus]QGX93860.1 hypothetical protein EI982_03195 [Haloplanus rallus]
MRERTAGLTIGVLAVVCFGLVLSVLYPFTTSSPDTANSAGERFTVGDADAFSATGRIAVEGETRLAFDGAVTTDGAWYQKVVDDGVVSEEYHPPSGPIYRRLTVEGVDAAEQRRARLTEDEDRTILRESRAGNCVTFVTTSETTSASEPVSGTASVFVNNLRVAAYETTETDSTGVTTYEPQSGWYESRVVYRLTDASGTVRVDDETGTVTSANVSWTETRGETYAHYVLSTVLHSSSTESRTTFAFDDTSPSLERPAWATDEETNATGTTNAC